jgi:hypothetical protein
VSRAFVALAVVACAALAGCGTPPELRPQPGSSVPQPSASASEDDSAFESEPPADVFPPPGQTATASPMPSFSEEYALPCDGFPSSDEVIALARRRGLLPRTGRVTVAKGPVCAGDWQYTILNVPRKDPLQIVSRGAPDSLTMVTAGTDVCSIEVRTEAPAGIRNAAFCPAPGG